LAEAAKPDGTRLEGVTTKSPKKGLLASVPRRVMLQIIVMAVNNFAISYLTIVIVAYLPQIGVSTATVGLVVGLEGLSMAILAIPLGFLSDRRGRKRILILGSLGIVPMFFVVAMTTETVPLVLAGMLGGVAEGSYLATVNALIADQTAPEDRDSAFTLSFILAGTGGSLGTALPFFVPALSLLFGLSSHSVHDGLLMFFGIVSAMLPVGLYFILRGYRETLRPGVGLLRGKSTRNLLKFSGINSLIGLGAGFIIPLIPAWLFLKFAVPDTYSGPILALAGATIGLAALYSPRLSRRLGPVKAITLTEGLSLVFMVSLAFMGNVTEAVLFYIIRAMLMNMSSPLSDSFLMGIVVPEERGLASSINSVIWRIPNSVTTIVGGAILASGNYVLPFLLAGAFYAVAISLFYPTFRNVKPVS